MPDIRIQPDELSAAVATVDGAAHALRGATAHLAAAQNNAQATFTHGWDGTAHHKVGTTVREWTKEFNLIADLLTAYRNVILQAAHVYAEADSQLAADLTKASADCRSGE